MDFIPNHLLKLERTYINICNLFIGCNAFTNNMSRNLQQQQYSNDKIATSNRVIYHAPISMLTNQRCYNGSMNAVHVTADSLPVWIPTSQRNNSVFHANLNATTSHVIPSMALGLQVNPQPLWIPSINSCQEDSCRRRVNCYPESYNLRPVQVSCFQEREEVSVDRAVSLSRVPVHNNNCSTCRIKYESKMCNGRNKRYPFPQVLYQMLMKADSMNFSDIISFLPHGRAFIVRDKSRFEEKVMPIFFSHKSYKSFRRYVSYRLHKVLMHSSCDKPYKLYTTL